MNWSEFILNVDLSEWIHCFGFNLTLIMFNETKTKKKNKNKRDNYAGESQIWLEDMIPRIFHLYKFYQATSNIWRDKKKKKGKMQKQRPTY